MSPTPGPGKSRKRPPDEFEGVHPIVIRAATGRLPEWARAGRSRREHMERVATLMRQWARAQGLPPVDVLRWSAVGYLHDVLREAPPGQLRPMVPPDFRHLPPSVLHGPAGAVALQEEGVDDAEFLHAVAFHTLGHPTFAPMGRALYAADFLEPGRKMRPRWRGALRKRMPHDTAEVLREIVGARIVHLVGRGSPVRTETLGFWNALVQQAGSA